MDIISPDEGFLVNGEDERATSRDHTISYKSFKEAVQGKFYFRVVEYQVVDAGYCTGTDNILGPRRMTQVGSERNSFRALSKRHNASNTVVVTPIVGCREVTMVL